MKLLSNDSAFWQKFLSNGADVIIVAQGGKFLDAVAHSCLSCTGYKPK